MQIIIYTAHIHYDCGYLLTTGKMEPILIYELTAFYFIFIFILLINAHDT